MSFDIFFDLCLNQQLSKQWRRPWFETPSRSLWHHCNVCFPVDKEDWDHPIFDVYEDVCRDQPGKDKDFAIGESWSQYSSVLWPIMLKHLMYYLIIALTHFSSEKYENLFQPNTCYNCRFGWQGNMPNDSPGHCSREDSAKPCNRKIT